MQVMSNVAMASRATGKQPKVRYSRGEQQVLDILRAQRKKPITTTELAALYYEGREMPLNGRQAVLSMLYMLQRKMTLNKESMRVDMSSRAGPYPLNVTLVSGK